MPLVDSEGLEIPRWKREMMAKKAVEKAKNAAIELKAQEEENRRLAAIPDWKRHLIEKKSEDPNR